MTHASPERNISFNGDTAAPTSLNSELSPEEIKEISTFATIDREVNTIISLQANSLSEIQAKSTDPDVLVDQTERFISNAEHAIDGGIETKRSLRLAAVALELKISRDQVDLDSVRVDDIYPSEEDRRRRIMDVLLANRTAREGQLQAKIKELQDSQETQQVRLDLYRLSLSEESPEAVAAFDEAFPALDREHEYTLTRTEELEIMANVDQPEVAVERPQSPTRAALKMATKAIRSMTNWLEPKMSVDLLAKQRANELEEVA